jgi:hypothetical protein
VELALADPPVGEGQVAGLRRAVARAPAEEGELGALALGEQAEGDDALGRGVAGDEEDGAVVAVHRRASS